MPSGERTTSGSQATGQPRAAIITGGGTGIGAALARELTADGVDVVLIGRRLDPLERAAVALRGSRGRVFALSGDVRDQPCVADMFDTATELLGRVPSILVNNAGGQFPQSALDITPGGWRAVVDTNLNGTFWMAQAFARAVVAASSPATILNMTIPWAVRGSVGLTHAVAARSGVIGLTKSLALEWAPYGIRVNCVAPGLVVTEGFVDEELDGDLERLEHLLASIPLGRAALVTEVAQLMAYLVSDRNGYMTGECVAFDGGAVLGPGINLMSQQSGDKRAHVG